MKKCYLLIAFLTVMLLAISCGATTPPPEISGDAKSMAIDGIMEYTLVRDAGVFQDGKKVNLVLIANSAINEQYAKELCDNFVRMVKQFSEDENPGKEIGKGIYDYLVGVYTPSEEEVVIGFKSADLPHITW